MQNFNHGLTHTPIRPQDPHSLHSLVDMHRAVQDQPMVFAYRGPFLDRFTHSILDISNGGLASQAPNLNRKVSFLIVECFQNIMRHGESLAGKEEDIHDDGLFSFRSGQTDFIINSINPVQAGDAAELQKLVDAINGLDTRELKELYIKQLNLTELSNKGGAGLGLIELARKSGRNILYELEPFRHDLVLFHQQITMSGEQESAQLINSIHDNRELYRRMSREQVMLYYKGDFSQKSILPILDIVEHNVTGGSTITNQSRKTGHVLVELLQNISRHGDNDQLRRRGIVGIGRRDGHVFLQAGNVVSSADRQILQDKMEYLTSLDNEGLQMLHKTALRSSLNFENKNRSGLGLIEIARAASQPLSWCFEHLAEDTYLFALQVTV